MFGLICDVLGFDEEDRRRLGLRGKQTDKGKVSFKKKVAASQRYCETIFSRSLMLVSFSQIVHATGKRSFGTIC